MSHMTDALPATTPALAMIRTLGLISMICGLIIVGAYQGTYDAVQENKRIAVERNGEVVPRSRWAGTPVLADDRLEIIGAVGGG